MAGGGWLLLAPALAVKVIAAYVLVPLIFGIERRRSPFRVALAGATLVPALLWYLYAAAVLAEGEGSRASTDNASIWFRVLGLGALFRIETIGYIGRFLMFRAFTPLGFALAVWGVVRRGDRLWRVWGGAALAALAFLAGKLHHEYYWLALRPVAAGGLALALKALAGWRPMVGTLTQATGLVGLAVAQSASTWRTPDEWRSSARSRARRARIRAARRLAGRPRGAVVRGRSARMPDGVAAGRGGPAAGEWGVTDLPGDRWP